MSDTYTLTKTMDPDVDPYGREVTSGTRESLVEMVMADFEWFMDLREGGEIDGQITLNTDNATNPTAYFLVFHFNDGSTQADTYMLVQNAA